MIDTKLLRQKILDLAIRGKLVPQDPTDEPASELLKKIKAEKEALVKAGKIKKDKHESHIFKGDDNRYYETIDGKTADITDEIPFDLPDGWAWCRLSSICQSVIDGDHQPPPQSPQGIPFLVISNISDGQLSFNQTRFVTEEYYNSLAEVRVPQCGDILLTVTGSYGIAVQIQENKKFCFQRHIALLKTILTNNKLLEQWLSSGFSKKQFDNSVTGTAQQTLGLNALRSTLLPLPPLSEQQRIVAQIEILLGYVDIIDTDAETLDKSITLAKQKILDLAIRGKLVPQDPADEPASELLKKIKAEKDALVKAGKLKKDKHESFIFKSDDNCYYEQLNGKTVDVSEEIPFDLPDSWSWCRFSTLVNFVMGKTPARSQKEFWDMPFLPWVSIADMIPGGVIKKTKEFISSNALSHCFSDRISPAGTLIMSFKLTIGRVSILNMPAQHNEAIISIFPFVDQENIHRDYLLKILPVMVDFVKKSPAIKGNTLNSDSLSKMLIPLPPLAEQERIVSCIAQFETILKSIQE